MKDIRMERARKEIALTTQVLERTVGDGTKFFDAMDELLCDQKWYEFSYDWFKKMYNKPFCIVVSGGWGRGFALWAMTHVNVPVIAVRGDLRHGELPPLHGDIDDKLFVFLDNSAYKGRTRDKIAQRLREKGGTLVDTFVLYDGSVEPIETIEGVFRYHGTGATIEGNT